MDFDDTPEEAAFRTEARAFLEAHATPKAGDESDWSRNVAVPDPEVAADFRRRCREWQRTLYDNGWAGIAWPKQFGGRGGTPAQQIIFSQEQAGFDVTAGFVAASQQLVGPTLMMHGSAEQQERYLGPLLRGDELWCQLFSEPGAGSDLATVHTRAVQDGGEWVVNGQKVWTSQAQYADFGILLARTDTEVPKHDGITFFIVDMKTSGIDVRPLVQAHGQAHFNEVFLSDVRIPHGNVVGDVNDGWKTAKTTLRNESSMIGGAGQSSNYVNVLTTARRRCTATDPVIRQELAVVYTNEQILRYMQMRMQTAVMHGRRPEFSGSVLKNMFTRALKHRTELAVSIEGAEGMLLHDAEADGFWQFQMINQFASRIGGGTEEVQRNNIGERDLDLPREPRVDRDVPYSQLPRS